MCRDRDTWLLMSCIRWPEETVRRCWLMEAQKLTVVVSTRDVRSGDFPTDEV